MTPSGTFGLSPWLTSDETAAEQQEMLLSCFVWLIYKSGDPLLFHV